MTPKAAQQLIRAHVKTALDRRAAFKPYVVRPPVTLDLVFKSYRPAEMLSYLSIVQRTTSHGIRLVGKDIIEVSRFWNSWGRTSRNDTMTAGGRAEH
jgi:D-aminopeptidase